MSSNAAGLPPVRAWAARTSLAIALAFIAASTGPAAEPVKTPNAPATAPPQKTAAAAAPHADDDSLDLIYLAPRRPIVIRLRVDYSGQSLRQMREAIARRIFKALDADKNDRLDGKELEGLPTPEALAAAAGFETPATGGSGSPNSPPRGSLEQIASLVRAHGGSMLSVTTSGTNAPSPNAAVFYAGEAPGGVDVVALLNVIDADGDRRVTVAECDRVDDILRMLDVNDDETVSSNEIVSAQAMESPTVAVANPVAGVATLLQAIDRDGSKTALVRKLTQLYDRAARDPKTRRAGRDRKLSAGELGIPAAELARFDKNGDHLLDAAELAAWLSDPEAQVELDVKVGKAAESAPAAAVRKLDPSVADAGITVKSGENGRVVLNVQQLPLEIRSVDPARRTRFRVSNFKAQFKQADQDNNGYLEISESQRIGVSPRDFAAMDRDHNGMVFEGEYLDFQRLRELLTEQRIALTLEASSPDPVAQFDSNGDGRLTRSEFRKALAEIKSWDRNHDGVIAPEEVRRDYFATFRVGPPGAGPSRPRPASAAMAARSGSTAWFDKMDRNRDGEISQREFLGPLAVFRQLDADHNGYLDGAEAAAAAPSRNEHSQAGTR
jgi:Ca2+-binding EF-hand superfamily protein